MNKTSRPAKATIRCTPENLPDMRALVRDWPELHNLVQNLQADGLFPGLRGLTVQITGPEAQNGLQGARNIIQATNPATQAQNSVETPPCS